MDPPMPVQLDAGAPKAEPSSGRDHDKRSKDRQKEKHKKSHKNGDREKSRHHERKHHKSKSQRRHRSDEPNKSPAPGGLESGEIDLPDASAEVASEAAKARTCTASAAEATNADTTGGAVKHDTCELNEQADKLNPPTVVQRSNKQPSGTAHNVTTTVAKPEHERDADQANRREQSKDRVRLDSSRRSEDDRKASRDYPQPSSRAKHDINRASALEHAAAESSGDRSRYRAASREQGTTRPADTAREARDRRLIERIGAERWDGDNPPERHRSQSRQEPEYVRAQPDRYAGRDRGTRERDARGDARGDLRGHRSDAHDGAREDSRRGRGGGAHGHRDFDAARGRTWDRERDCGVAHGGRRDVRDATRGGRAAGADLRGGERGRTRGAHEPSVLRKRTRSVSPRSKAARQRRHEAGRTAAEADGMDALAAFEDMMTAEEREAKELEERRRRRAELEAKLAASASAPASTTGEARSPCTTTPGDSQAGARSPDAGHACDGGAANGQGPPMHHADGALAADAGVDVAGLVSSTIAGPDYQGADGDDAVSIGSDAEEQQMEDLFRSAKQGVVPQPAGAVDSTQAADDDDEDGDLFAEDDDADARVGEMAIDGAAEAPVHDDRRDARQAEGFRKANTGLSDMYDDSQGYYNFRVGELMGSRYEVIKASGKGVFSSVVAATDKLRQNSEGVNPLVAIKVIRANDTMYKAGKLELQILTKLAEADPENRRHVIRLLRSFEYRHHLCMVFEHMEMNLRELTRKVGVGRGIRIDAVGQLALQMLLALKHLRSNDVLHADIKPDNILINARMNKIKLCDLGSATFRGSHNEPTPYLVSRFYRAPEVILGLPYDFPMDMWSIACTIYELFTADILFKGRNNNEMLKLIMHLKGPLPKKMIRKGLFANQHFADDSNLNFIATETDVVTKEPVKRLVSHFPPGKGFLSLLLKVASKEFQGNIPRDERRKLEMFATFLDKATELDPAKRLTPEAAMKEKFIETAKQQITMQYNAHRSKTK